MNYAGGSENLCINYEMNRLHAIYVATPTPLQRNDISINLNKIFTLFV